MALNKGGITGGIKSGRVNFQNITTGNYASTRIQVNGADANNYVATFKNRANTYLNTYQKDLQSNTTAPGDGWSNAWIFNETNRPKLKQVNADDTYGDALSGQPNLSAADYLKSQDDYNDPLTLESRSDPDKESIKLTYVNDRWIYYWEGGNDPGAPGLPFNGTVTSEGKEAFTNYMEITNVPEEASPLIFDGAQIAATSRTGLTVSSNSKVTIQTTEKTSTLSGTYGINLMIGNQLTLTGKNLIVKAKNEAILNRGTLYNRMMAECWLQR